MEIFAQRTRILCCFVFVFLLAAGCTSNPVQRSTGGTAAAAGTTDAIKSAQTSDNLKKPKVTINGVTFTVNGRAYDISQLGRDVNTIVQCKYITDTVFILECHSSPKTGFYALFNVGTKDYVSCFYGTNCTWKDNDLGSVIYVFGNTVRDAACQTLWTVDMTETQRINNLKYSQDGRKLTVTVCDDNSLENDVKTYEFSDINNVVSALSAAFEKNGFDVKHAHGSKSILDGERSTLTLTKGAGEEPLQLYAYSSSEAASADMAKLNGEGCTYGATDGTLSSFTCISWVSSPHFYLKDNAIVLYVGSSREICDIISTVCGDQIKGMKE